MKYAAAAAAGLAAGVAAGFALGRLPRDGSGQEPPGRRAFVERRAGRHQLVNPLLDCDLAAGAAGNRDLEPFRDELERRLRERARSAGAPRVSVYFRELDDGLWFSIGEAEQFAPASLRKLPMLIAVLKEAERPGGQGLLDREVTFDLSRDYNQDQNVKPSQVMVPGARYPVRELLRRMIVYSDNNAFAQLGKVIDPPELDRAYALLRMQSPGAADDRYQSVQTYASFFRVLYNATYLGADASEWALTTLAQSEFRSGLVAGVPPGTPVAHKFGEKSEAGGAVQLHDCGIVYYPKNPYLLCVMSSGRDFARLDDEIEAVSRWVWEQVAAQLGGTARAGAAPTPTGPR